MLQYPAHHFRAEIEILPLGPNTRCTYTFNGIRWNVVFKEDFDEKGSDATQLAIWPLFRSTDDTLLSDQIPIKGILPATMHVMFPEAVESYLERVKVGGEFYCIEGARVVAQGRITSVSESPR